MTPFHRVNERTHGWLVAHVSLRLPVTACNEQRDLGPRTLKIGPRRRPERNLVHPEKHHAAFVRRVKRLLRPRRFTLVRAAGAR
jgi:hypothetical protein